MDMSFKRYVESYAEMGFYLGSEDVFDAINDTSTNHDIISAAKHGKKIIDLVNSLDKYIGMKKMFLLLGPTTNVLINSGIALTRVARNPSKLSSWVALKDDAIELAKLSAMNPLISAPIALGMTKLAGMGEKQEIVLLMTKIVSSIYFYLESVMKLMENSKLEQVRKMAVVMKNKVEKLMPKSQMPH